MSHQLATQAGRSTRRTAQVIRYSAIVTASMASIGLTVAAGSYIANEMAHEPGKLAISPPADRPALIERGGSDRPNVQAAAPIAQQADLASLFTNRPLEPALTQAGPARVSGTGAAPATPRPLAGQVRLGTTYLGAQFAAAQHNSVTLTVDTNVFAVLSDVLLHTPLGEQLGITIDPSANTQLRTDVDSHGDVTLTLSDPGIGQHGVQIVRHPVGADSNRPVGADSDHPVEADSNTTAV